MGNWDWSLSLAETYDRGPRVWKHDVILVDGGAGRLVPVPVAQDFDLASIVVGRLRRARTVPTEADLRASVKDALATTSTGLTPDEMAAATARLLAKKAELYAVVADADVDEAGRANARMHLDAFFAEIER
jgi:hypothetical protein